MSFYTCNGKKISDEGRIIGRGMSFQRTRRITGYLVDDLDRWNTSKACEERDRVKHCMKELVIRQNNAD